MISSASSRIGCIRVRSSRIPAVDRAVRRQRMRPARLAEPADQRFVARLEEDQHRVEPRHLAQPPKIFGNDDRKFPSRTSTTIATCRCRRRPAATAGQRRDRRRREVVDAEVPRSSSARIACDFPEPDSPVRTMNGCPLLARPAGLPSRATALLPCLPRLLTASSSSSSSSSPAGRSSARAQRLLEPVGESPRRMMPARPQQLVARGHFDEDRDVRPGATGIRISGTGGRESRKTGRPDPGDRTRAPDSTVRAGPRARRASTSASSDAEQILDVDHPTPRSSM